MTSKKTSSTTSQKKTTPSSGSPRGRGRPPGSSSSPPRMMGLRAWAKHPGVFQKYLDGLTSARPFITEARTHFLNRLRPYQRKAILKRLKEIDPDGAKELTTFKKRLIRAKKAINESAIAEVVRETELAVAESDFDAHGVTTVRFIPFEGVKDNIAAMLASGFSRVEVCDKLQVGSETVALITSEDIERMRRKLPEAIVQAADARVMKDLIEDNVDGNTERADRIAGRRRKIYLAAMDREKDKLPPKDGDDHGEDHKRFFDVEEEPDEKTDREDGVRRLPGKGVRD